MVFGEMVHGTGYLWSKVVRGMMSGRVYAASGVSDAGGCRAITSSWSLLAACRRGVWP